MPYDPDVGYFTRLVLPSEIRRARRRASSRPLFVKGPIPLSVVDRCRLAHREALPVLLRIKVEADRFGEPVVASSKLADEAKLHPKALARALSALETGGLIECERARGRAPRVWLASGLFDIPD
jgi:hypothetical protein